MTEKRAGTVVKLVTSTTPPHPPKAKRSTKAIKPKSAQLRFPLNPKLLVPNLTLILKQIEDMLEDALVKQAHLAVNDKRAVARVRQGINHINRLLTAQLKDE